MINLKTPNLIAFIVLLTLGGFVAGRQEMKARKLEKEIRKRRVENLAKVPVIEEKLKNESLSPEDKKELEHELRLSKDGLPNTAPYRVYNIRILGWPLGITLMFSGIICLFVKS